MSRLIQTIWGHLRKPGTEKSGTRRTSRPLRLEGLEERCVLTGNASGVISGVTFVDFNLNGTRDPGEVILPGIQTTLTGSTNQGVSVHVTTTTDANGMYSFLNVQPGTYQLSYLSSPGLLGAPTGGEISSSNGINLVSQFLFQGGQSTGTNVGFRGLSPEAISLREFLSFTTGEPSLPNPGSGVGLASYRANSAPTVDAGANLAIAGIKNSSSQIDLASIFSDSDTTNSEVTFQTSAGNLTVQLFDSQAPQTVANFFNYITSGQYDNSIFSRLGAFLHGASTTKDVLQGGLFNFSDSTGQGQLTPITTGPPVADEVSLPNTAGTISMAKTGAPNSATSQFFFNLIDNTTALDPANQPNGGFTVFGTIDPTSQSVLNALANFNVRNLSSFNSSLTDLPLRSSANITGFPTNTVSSDYDYINRVIVDRRDEFLTYSVVADNNPGLVQASLVNNHLTLNYLPGQTGTATITIRATDTFGATKDATFTVTVTDPPPTVSVSLSNPAPKTNDTLTATAVPVDASGDPVTLTYVWSVNGTVVQTFSNTSAKTDTLDLRTAGYGDKGNTITVTVTPNDGKADGPVATATATVANTAPVIDSVTITPSMPTTIDTLNATPTSHDDDQDTVTYTYQWMQNMMVIPNATNESLDLSGVGTVMSGDLFTVQVTPSDGTTAGATFTQSINLP